MDGGRWTWARSPPHGLVIRDGRLLRTAPVHPPGPRRSTSASPSRDPRTRIAVPPPVLADRPRVPLFDPLGAGGGTGRRDTLGPGGTARRSVGGRSGHDRAGPQVRCLVLDVPRKPNVPRSPVGTTPWRTRTSPTMPSGWTPGWTAVPVRTQEAHPRADARAAAPPPAERVPEPGGHGPEDERSPTDVDRGGRSSSWPRQWASTWAPPTR